MPHLDYQLDIVNQVLIYGILALSLNLLMGYAGQASIGHAAFGAVGGYLAGYLSAKHGVDFVPAVLLAIAFSFVIGTLVALPALRLSEEYLILLTLAFSTIVLSIINSWGALGGAYGLLGIKTVSIAGKDLITPSELFWLMLALTIVVFLICWRLGQSPFGRVLKAIREDETAARSLGKNVFWYKVMVFGITSAMAGLAGALFVYYNQLASPAEFSIDVSIAIIAMVVFGGSGNLFGSLLGAALIVVSAPVLEHAVSLGAEKAALWRLLIYGVALAALMIVRPQGILPERASATDWLNTLTRRRPRLTPAAASLMPPPPAPRLGAEGGLAMVAAAGGGSALATAGAERPDVMAAVATAAAGAAAPAGHGAASGEDATPRAAIQPSVAVPPALVVRGLKKRFGGIIAVDGVDLELPAGEVTGLIGPNGAGKSTLFGLFTGFLAPDEGTVVLNGRDVRGRSPDRIAKLGMVRSFQDVRLFQLLTVLENVMLAIPHNPGEDLSGLFLRPAAVSAAERTARERALEYLAFVGLAQKADWLAAGLAFAEQKLAAIARVLATGADILLLDEPTSGVDPRWVDSVAQVIRELPSLGKTVCIVEHNLSFLQKVGAPVYFMEAGRITAKGSVGDLMTDERLRKAYFGM